MEIAAFVTGGGSVQVVLSGSSELDTDEVELDSLRFGPDQVRPVYRRTLPVDVDRDGHRDLLLEFSHDLQPLLEASEFCLSGMHRSQAFEGCTTFARPTAVPILRRGRRR